MDAKTVSKIKKIEAELRKASQLHASQADRLEAIRKGEAVYSSRKRKAKKESK